MDTTYEIEERTGDIVRAADGARIPRDPENTDFRNYLIWLESQESKSDD